MQWLKRNIAVLTLSAAIILMTMGVIFLLYPFNAYVKLVKYLGPALFLNSIILFISAYQYPAASITRTWVISKSVLDLVAALILTFNPFFTFIFFPLLAGPLLIGSGMLKITGGILIRRNTGVWPATLWGGLLFVLFGCLLSRTSYGPDMKLGFMPGSFLILQSLVYLLDALWLKKQLFKITYGQQG